MNQTEQKFLDELRRDGYEYLTRVNIYEYERSDIFGPYYRKYGNVGLVGKPLGNNLMIFKVFTSFSIFDVIEESKTLRLARADGSYGAGKELLDVNASICWKGKTYYFKNPYDRYL